MRIETALNHRQRAETALADLWSAARIYHMPHDEILKRKYEIMQTVSHCPGWVRYYLAGADSVHFKKHYDNLEFCYLVDGELFSTWKKSDRCWTSITGLLQTMPKRN